MQAAALPERREPAEATDRAKYIPPSDWRTVSVQDLLAGSSRSNLGGRQVDWVTSLANGGGDLFVAGDTDLLKRHCVSVIGARAATLAGRQRARQFARQLVQKGVVIVSGLADGIDTEALTAAIDAGGKVIAVIGTPLDQAYPAKNKRLQEVIYRDHLLISQFPSGQRVFPSNFPARNRTMAALSDASVVMEASDTSGTLHQAAECVNLGRFLGITNAVLTDPKLTWPARFTTYERFVPLESTDQFLRTVYG